MASPSSSTAGAAASSSSSNSSVLLRPWSDLSSDLLISIFSNLPTAELLTGVSAVCSAWRSAARDPHCWRVIDLSDWSSVTARVLVPVSFGQVFSRALGFANGAERAEEVHLPPVADEDDLLLVSQRLPNLRYFSFPHLVFHPETISVAPANFESLNGMSVYPVFLYLYLLYSSVRTTHLRDLSELKLLHEEYNFCPNYSLTLEQICKYLPKLRKLEIPSSQISTSDIKMLLELLRDLEYLDISGCNNLGITEEVLEKAGRLKVFVWDSGRDLSVSDWSKGNGVAG